MKAFRKAFSRKSKSGSDPADLAASHGPSCGYRANLIDNEVDQPNISRALSELKSAIAKFKHNYEEFSEKNQRFIRIDRYHDVQKAMEKAGKEQDIRRSARIFETEISATLQVTRKKQDFSNSKWVGKLINFMTNVYPVARLSLGLTSAIAQVHPSWLALI